MFTIRSLLPIFLGLIFLTTFEFRVVDLLHKDNTASHAEIACGVLTGSPLLKVWQSRLLGPLIVGAASDISGMTLIKSYRITCLTLLLAANIISFFLFRKASGSDKTASILTLSGAILFVVLQDRNQLHIWDFIDLSVMSLFAYAVFQGASFRFLFLLFIVGLLNRESALFIALWLVLNAVTLSTGRPLKAFQVNAKHAGAGVLLLAAGIAWTQLLRETLFVRQTGDLHSSLQLVGNQLWVLPHILAVLKSAHFMDKIVPAIAMGATLSLLAGAGNTLKSQAWKVGVLIGAMLVANFMLGVVTETRVWFIFIPFWLWMGYITWQDRYLHSSA